jgi:hypothetical protein
MNMKTLAIVLALAPALAFADAASDATRADLVNFRPVSYQFDVPYTGTLFTAIDSICVSKPSGSLGAVLNPADFGAAWLPTPLSFTGQLLPNNHIRWSIDQRVGQCLDVPVAGGTRRVWVDAIHGQLEAVITDLSWGPAPVAPVGSICGQARSNLATFISVMSDSANQLLIDVNAACDLRTGITAATIPLHGFAFSGTFSVAAPPVPAPPPPVHVTQVTVNPNHLCQHMAARSAVDTVATVRLSRAADAGGQHVVLSVTPGLKLDSDGVDIAAGQVSANVPVHVGADFGGFGQVSAETDVWRTSGLITMGFDFTPPSKVCQPMSFADVRKKYPKMKLPGPYPDPQIKVVGDTLQQLIQVQPMATTRVTMPAAKVQTLQKSVVQPVNKANQIQLKP